ncbi:uncharacterized protein B0J16DRAFT_348212 [Fusarium flagelliforme]|uniref:uncharacterized protein n=1 Tax=Fusarium flagelliforme TaxID=2675880 RepID=UPI001E8ECC7B|nr:uncharacterized protein B0J16DRAFT_348212 [Fusarium flagelliforme]KAH7174137.1 hypothetical protein B0J16DRAFT_348212 [Fusarium flagelliforme]
MLWRPTDRLSTKLVLFGLFRGVLFPSELVSLESTLKWLRSAPHDKKDKIKHKVIENVALTAPNWVTRKMLTLMWNTRSKIDIPAFKPK